MAAELCLTTIRDHRDTENDRVMINTGKYSIPKRQWCRTFDLMSHTVLIQTR